MDISEFEIAANKVYSRYMERILGRQYKTDGWISLADARLQRMPIRVLRQVTRHDKLIKKHNLTALLAYLSGSGKIKMDGKYIKVVEMPSELW